MLVYKTYRVSKTTNIASHQFSINDFKNMDFRTLIMMLGTFMPIVRLIHKQDSYLIGAECKKMTVKNNDCMVHVGGGYVNIQ